MSLLNDLSNKRLAARKDHDKVALALLSILIADINRSARPGEVVNDGKTIGAIKVFLDNAQETKRLLEQRFEQVMGHPCTDGKTRLLAEKDSPFLEDIVPKLQTVGYEIRLLDSWLPKELTEAELLGQIEAFKAQPDASFPTFMAHLKANFAGRFNGKLASELAKAAFS